MDYRILGPLEVSDGDRPLALGGERQRALLAILLLHAGEVVSVDRLIDDLWVSDPRPERRRRYRRTSPGYAKHSMPTEPAHPQRTESQRGAPLPGCL